MIGVNLEGREKEMIQQLLLLEKKRLFDEKQEGKKGVEGHQDKF